MEQPNEKSKMKKRIVYLAGLMSTEYPESLKWRDAEAPILEKLGFEVRTPLVGHKNLSRESPDGGITSTVTTTKQVILRDHRDVCEADVILAHLDNFGSPRPLTGTIAELAWAWRDRKIVLGVAAKNNYLMRNHPFIQEFVSIYCETLGQANRALARFFL